MRLKRWSLTAQDEIEVPKIDAFLLEVIEVSKKHGLSISHEDGHGSFLVKEYNQDDVEWLMNATDRS